ncbi:GTP-binding protein TrmE [Macrophomina phaseolina MS6]|uniref:GTP-binding protein TrmE n=1 Tax=Macrophomina phaseolina (strain MS6) TaxID=1126212 RepID=K2RF18_MACPH|nr:GTP-binding protein TrmE [Macrophomina phaseolina MS6]
MLPLRRAATRCSSRRLVCLVPTRPLAPSSPWVELSSRAIAPWHPAHIFQPKSARFPHSDAAASADEPSIYALSTAPGRAAVAIIRISGPACTDIYHSLCPGKPLPRPRHAALRTLYDPAAALPPPSSAILDHALVLFFRGPSSVTGEDLLELHVHGGPAIVRAVLSAIPKCDRRRSKTSPSAPSIRYAEPGEFTRRAYLNSRLSLPQVEALGDTLTATTEQQRLLSVRGASSSSRLAQRYDDWSRALLYARGELEALIDFSEDQHFDEAPAQLAASVAQQVVAVVNKSDMIPADSREEQQHRYVSAIQKELDLPSERIYFISCKEAASPTSSSASSDPGNIQGLLSGLISVFKEMTTPIVPELDGVSAPDMSVWQESLGATERQRVLLEECSMYLEDFLLEVEEGEQQMEGELDIVLAAEKLRAAATCLAKITGKGEAGDVEEVLGVVFEKFCVGK